MNSYGIAAAEGGWQEAIRAAYDSGYNDGVDDLKWSIKQLEEEVKNLEAELKEWEDHAEAIKYAAYEVSQMKK